MVGSHTIHILWLQVTCNTYVIYCCDQWLVNGWCITYYIYIYVLLSSHQLRLVYYIYTETLWFTHVSFSDKTIREGVWTCGQRAPTRTPLPHPHPHTHLPTSRLAWSSRTMSHLEGNPSAASSSVVASYAANSSSVEADGSAASSAPGSNPVDVGEPPVAVLQPPNTAETTVSQTRCN